MISSDTDSISILHVTFEEDWSTTPPNEPGYYWFYGEDLLGEMGEDFRPGKVYKPRLRLVNIIKGGNGLIAITEGHFMGLKKFDKINPNSRGHLGYWKPAILPDTPEDAEKYFKNIES